jgi:hypothetical protein
VKLHLLDLGGLEYDEGWPVAAAGLSTVSKRTPTRRPGPSRSSQRSSSTPTPARSCSTPARRRTTPSCGRRSVQELFSITGYEREHHLDAAIQVAG